LYLGRRLHQHEQRHDRAHVVDAGGRLELFEAKWTELPAAGDAANLDFVRNAVGKARIGEGAVVCRARNSFPLAGGFRALAVADLA